MYGFLRSLSGFVFPVSRRRCLLTYLSPQSVDEQLIPFKGRLIMKQVIFFLSLSLLFSLFFCLFRLAVSGSFAAVAFLAVHQEKAPEMGHQGLV